MDKLQDLNQSELQDLLDNSERVESMALESDEVGRLFLYTPVCGWKPQHFFMNVSYQLIKVKCE